MELNENKIVFEKATLSDVDKLLHIIHRCLKEVNSTDYEPYEIEEFLKGFNKERISNSIMNRHFYLVKYNEEIIGMGAVNRDLSQESQSFFTTIFINPDYHRMGIGRKLISFLEQDEWCLESNLIEIPSSKSSHEFYHKLGYEYRTNPPVFKEDGSTVMYKNK
jgi:N-acetylglutamate synthase-like GNAT family acetyltransferase